jgi:hypothetical protein
VRSDHTVTELLRALELGAEQQAKSLRLRAAMSLMRHARAHGGNTKEFRRRLADIYDQFTEGAFTPDLVETKTLLER